MAPPQGPHGPMDRMGRWDDPELAEILGQDPELYELARTVRASRPEPQVGPHFEPYLRAKLMDEAARELRPRGVARWLRPRAGLLAGGGAALGVAMIAAVVLATVMYHPNDTTSVAVSTNVSENHQVSTDDVIRVSFSQPVDHAAVEHNLSIHPATSVQTHWEANTLVITPLHHLAANTPYSVTIPRTAVRDQSGHATAPADIHITFGTAPTPSAAPTAAPAQPPALQPQVLGAVSGDSHVLVAPDGSVVATSAEVQTTASSTPRATSSPTPALGLPTSLFPAPGRSTPAPGSTASATASAGATVLRMLELGGANGPVVLGPAAVTATYSPSGHSLAYLVTHGGTANLVVAHADGSGATTLARGVEATSPLAWSGSEDSLLYVSASGQVTTVDLQGRSRPVDGLRLGQGQDVAFAPGGAVAYVGPQPSSVPSGSPSAGAAAASPTAGTTATVSPEALGHLVELSSGTIVPLQGIGQLPAFSGDGATVAWIDASGATPVLDVMRADGSANASVVPTSAGAGDTVANLALSGDGTRLAYTLAQGTAAAALRVVTASSGELIAVGDGQPVQSPALSQDGGRIAFLRPTSDGLAAAVAVIPGSVQSTPAHDAVPVEASTALDQFVAAQLRRDLTALQSLVGPGLTVDGSLIPEHVTRSYVIKAALDPTSGAVLAHVRLVRDASQSALAAAFADETLQLASAGAGQPYQVTSATLSSFQSEPNGPQVVHVDTSREGSALLVIRVAFDSDMDPATVTAAAITLASTGVSGTVTLPADVRYDVESRTVVIRVVDVASGTLLLSLSDAVHDITGASLSGGYSTTVQG
jgi:hypothetical protein